MGHYSLSQVLNLATSVGLGAQLVTHVIATSKDFIEGVGKGTDVHILRDDGLHDSLVRPECLKVEEQFLRLFSMFREVVSCAELWKTDEDLNFWMNQLQGAIEGLRNSQREHNERKRLQANRITEARPNRIPARDGPLLPQPSPESHGESGES